jgi:hypothetical protein
MNRKRPWNDPVTLANFHANFKRCECGCLRWQGGHRVKDEVEDYGTVKFNDFPDLKEGRQTVYIHRAAWVIAHGPIPKGMQVHHKHGLCKHKNCGDVSHMELLTAFEHSEISNGWQWHRDDFEEREEL